ncbi:dimethyladenosine transferase [Edhazardia aedis USNM 41457]|uniref:rRNA adenine N(6)-methyltransferase n=1 Tax=Edhazardia aedis (strain USNM 41457) TaxID=1003232 RepID=J9DAS8_EDHAE|nr:dimethyladenosine transferase [Edhazardia aedis USNM 41457]|eukprot:EJW04579.1 dimethyladenosine transferase [Edhazardia aedis USNM 41457]
MANPLFNKKLGQHILVNQTIIDTIITRAKIKSTDVVLEIGGGTGNLTMKLLEKAKRVVCYEKDPRLAMELVKKVNSVKGLVNKFELIVGDALKHDFPYFDLCISNIPYQISSPLTFKLLSYNFNAAYLMFQKEFADRLVAKPGSKEWCRLSVAVQIVANTEHVLNVSKKNFRPPPKVESSVVKIKPRYPKPPINLEELNKLLKICFLRRNKTLGSIFKGKGVKNIIKASLNEEDDCEKIVEDVLSRIDAGKMRSAKMSIEDFLVLMLEFKKENLHLS